MVKKNMTKKNITKKNTKKHLRSKKRKNNNTKKNIKLLIKTLGKKRYKNKKTLKHKFKRIQYGCSNKMKGGGPLYQPLEYGYDQFKDFGNNIVDTVYGNNIDYREIY